MYLHFRLEFGKDFKIRFSCKVRFKASRQIAGALQEK